jgi:hypothetical protein
LFRAQVLLSYGLERWVLRETTSVWALVGGALVACGVLLVACAGGGSSTSPPLDEAGHAAAEARMPATPGQGAGYMVMPRQSNSSFSEQRVARGAGNWLGGATEPASRVDDGRRPVSDEEDDPLLQGGNGRIVPRNRQQLLLPPQGSLAAPLASPSLSSTTSV